jgi:hypothetical protein
MSQSPIAESNDSTTQPIVLDDVGEGEKELTESKPGKTKIFELLDKFGKVLMWGQETPSKLSVILWLAYAGILYSTVTKTPFNQSRFTVHCCCTWFVLLALVCLFTKGNLRFPL